MLLSAGPAKLLETCPVAPPPIATRTCARAAWIAGAPHFFFYGDRGAIAERELRLAENVLLVEHGDVLVRIEGALGRDAAVQIARSLQPR